MLQCPACLWLLRPNMDISTAERGDCRAEAARRPYSNFSELIHAFGMMLAASKALVDAL